MMPTSPKDKSLEEQILWGKMHDVFRTWEAKRLLHVYEIEPFDQEMAELVRDHLRRPLDLEHQGESVPFHLSRSKKGDIVLGDDMVDEAVKVAVRTFAAHLGVFSNSGGGKTNFMNFFLPQVAATGCHVWASDPVKESLRHLRPHFKAVGEDLVVMRPKDLRLNVFQQTPGSNPNQQIALATDVISRVLAVPPRAMSLFRSTTYQNFDKFKVFEDSGHWPTLFHIYEDIRKNTSSNQPARDAILDKFDPFLRALGKSGAYTCGYTADKLQNHSIIFEQKEASEQVKQVTLEPLLYAAMNHRVLHGAPNATLDDGGLMVAFDDSQKFFASQRSGDSGLSSFDELSGIVRGQGMSLCIIIQTTQGFSRRLIPNLATRIIGRLGCHEDYASLGADMGLSSEQLLWLKLNLRPGLMCVQLAEGGWRHPFLLQVPFTPLEPTVTDEEASESVKALDGIQTVLCEEFEHWPGRPPELSTEEDGASKQEIQALSKELLDYLEAIAGNPLLSTSERMEALGLSSYKNDRITNDLIENGLVKKVAINPGKGRGSSFTLLELSAQAVDLLASLDVQGSTGMGRGGIQHQWWAKEISSWLQDEGATATVEDGSKGARVDVALRTASGLDLAIEIDLSGRETENIRKDISAKYNHVVTLVPDKKRIETVRRNVEEEFGRDALAFVTIAQLKDYRSVLGPLLSSTSDPKSTP